MKVNDALRLIAGTMLPGLWSWFHWDSQWYITKTGYGLPLLLALICCNLGWPSGARWWWF